MWDLVLSILVMIHLVTEYAHYLYEYFSGKKGTNILEDIQKHRKHSIKTKLLLQIQRDLDAIKKQLEIPG